MAIQIVDFMDARQNLEEVMDRVHDDRLIIVTREDAAPTVLISLDEYDRMVETMNLLQSKEKLERLSSSIAALHADQAALFTSRE